MITHYASKSKGRTAIAEMHDAWLANTVASLTKSRADPKMLGALQGEQARRAATTPAPERTIHLS